MEDLKDIPGPKILHCLTKKGAGYKFSEEGNPTKWHAPGVFNKDTGEIEDKKYREKDTSTKDFWSSILDSESFANFIESKYRVASADIMQNYEDEE